MMMLLTRQQIDPNTQADVSYFKSRIESPYSDTKGLTRWPWELHRYGFSLDQFAPNKHGLRMRLSESDQARLDLEFMPMIAQRDWTRTFPIVDSTASELEKIEIRPEEDFACIHVRRGDYLRVASRTISFHETLRLSHDLRALLPRNVVFLSDDPFSADEVEAASKLLYEKTCTFLSGSDQHASHGILRMASILVTSNSTFSWSAGMLSMHPDVVIVSPQHFHGPGHRATNALFQSVSDWMIWSRLST